MKYLPLQSSIFSENRQNFISRMLPGSVAIFHSNDEQPRSGDQFYPFRQNPDFFYLTGIDQEKSILILFPQSPNPALREVLFILETNEHIAIWEGPKFTKNEATRASGISRVEWLPMFDPILREAMSYAEHVYLSTNENPRYAGEADYRNLRFAHELMRKFPLHKYQRATPALSAQRLVKSPAEIEIIQKAIEITGKAFIRVMRFVKPGVAEYEIEAEVSHEYLKNRASGHSFAPIIASGANACVLHYVKNNQVCRDGDLLLLDTGAEYANYAGDLTRTFPVNGRFSARQKQVYLACLRVMRAARAMLLPGTCIDAYHKEVLKIMEQELLALGLLSRLDIDNQDPDNPAVKKFFPHGTSHFIGLDVHDQGHRFETFRPGMLLSCEPGIYIRQEGLGIRIENNILITESGPRDLTENIPVEVEEIEEIMNS